jgi:hypothetical protein
MTEPRTDAGKALLEWAANAMPAQRQDIWREHVRAIEAEAAAGTALDADLIQRVMFRLVGTSHVPDLDKGGVVFLAHREFAELFAAEYARLAGVEEGSK